jgi:Flp pilus assembly protein CpaB
MKISRPAIFLGLGVVLALLAGVLVFVATQQVAAPKPVEQTVSVVVAKIDIPERTIITPQQVETRDYPKSLVPSGAITTVDTAIRQTTLAKIPIGAPILSSQVVSGGGSTGQSLTLEAGKVRVAFPIADSLVNAGQIQRGDRVDILATITPPVPTPGPVASGTPAVALPPSVPLTQSVVQNLEVIDIPVKGVLIFEVDHQTSIVLKALRDGGALLDLVIRSRAETGDVKTVPVDSGYIVKTYGFR